MTMNSGGEKLSEGWSREEEIDPAVGALTRLERKYIWLDVNSVAIKSEPVTMFVVCKVYFR